MISTIVWGGGSIARDAVRAVHAHPALALSAVLTTDGARTGCDAGELAGLDRTLGITVTDDTTAVLAARPRAVVYAGSGRVRSADARAHVVTALRAGAVVVTPPIHPLYEHRGRFPLVHPEIHAAVAEGGGSLYVGDVDPGWANHVLPLALRAVSAGATSIRCRDIVDYSGFDLPGSVRFLLGMGEPLSYLPPMLAPRMPTMVWGDRVRLLARAIGVELDEIRETLDRVELEVGVETETMGKFEAGGQGAVRFEVQGVVAGRNRVVIEHVGRIHPDAAPDWPALPESGAVHTVLVEGDPRIAVTVEPGARDGAAVAVDHLVDVIGRLVAREPGIYDVLDLAGPAPDRPGDQVPQLP